MPKKTTLNPKSEKKVIAKIVLGSLSKSELISKIKELENQLIKSKLDLTVGRLKNVRQNFNLRKQLARLKTVLHAKISD